MPNEVVVKKEDNLTLDELVGKLERNEPLTPEERQSLTEQLKEENKGGELGESKSMNIKWIFKTILVVMIIAVVVYVVYDKNFNRAEKVEKSLSNQKEEEARTNEFSYRGDAVLLAIKYKVDEEKVFHFLVERKRTYSPGMTVEELLKIYNNSITKNDLTLSSKKYDIPIDILAGILIDYNSMNTVCE